MKKLLVIITLLSYVAIVTAATVTDTYYTVAGDGYILYQGNPDWNTTHNAASGTNVFPTTGQYGFNAKTRHDGTNYRIYRAFLPFDTSGLSDTVSITSAVVKLYVDTVNDTGGAQSYTVVVGTTTQPSSATLTVNDYDDCAATQSPTEVSAQVLNASVTAGQYNSWTLNSTGIAYISKTGITYFGLRAGGDVEDIAQGASSIDGVEGTCMEYTGTARDPKIEITYEIPDPTGDTEGAPKAAGKDSGKSSGKQD